MKWMVLNYEGNTQEGLFRFVGDELLRNKWIKDSYLLALREREAYYPTGLNLELVVPDCNFNIAVPHADAIHNCVNALIFVLLKEPIPFGHMIAPSEKLDVNLAIFMLADNPKNHMNYLPKIIKVFQDKMAIQAFKITHNVTELQKNVNHYFKEDNND